MKPTKKLVSTIVFVTIFLLSKGNIHGQTVLLSPAELYIGATYGINASIINFHPRIEQGYLLGNSGGLSLRYITEEHFGLQIELNYSQRGWTEKNTDYTRKIDYIELPFLTHLYFGNTHRFFVNLGPKVGYVFNETAVGDVSASYAEQHVKPVYFPFDYGIAVGIGYNLHSVRAGVFQFELRGYYALSDVFANTKTDYFDTSNMINASASIGWYFQLTGRKKKALTPENVLGDNESLSTFR